MRAIAQRPLLTLGLLFPWLLSGYTGEETSATLPSAPQYTNRYLVTGDGSEFFLVSMPGAPVLHWLAMNPAGPLTDPTDFPGLTHAIARASLSGTEAPTAENQPGSLVLNLDRLEELQQRLKNLPTDTPSETASRLRQELDNQANEIRRFSDPLAWEKRLRQAPASGSKLQQVPGYAVLQITTTTSAARAVAELVKERRDLAVLRHVDTHYQEERQLWLAQQTQAETRALRYLLAKSPTTYPYHSALAQESTARVSRPQAMQIYRQTYAPQQCRHILIGSFPTDEVVKMLEEVFSPPPSKDKQQQSKEPAKKAINHFPEPIATKTTGQDLLPVQEPPPLQDPDLWIGCPLPRVYNPLHLAILIRWLSNGDAGYLIEDLRNQGHQQTTVDITLPLAGSSGMLLIHVQDPEAKTPEQRQDLLQLLHDALDRACYYGPTTEQLLEGQQHLKAQQSQALSHATGLGLYLARFWALSGSVPWSGLKADQPVNADQCGSLILKVFRRSNRLTSLAEKSEVDLPAEIEPIAPEESR